MLLNEKASNITTNIEQLSNTVCTTIYSDLGADTLTKEDLNEVIDTYNTTIENGQVNGNEYSYDYIDAEGVVIQTVVSNVAKEINSSDSLNIEFIYDEDDIRNVLDSEVPVKINKILNNVVIQGVTGSIACNLVATIIKGEAEEPIQYSVSLVTGSLAGVATEGVVGLTLTAFGLTGFFPGVIAGLVGGAVAYYVDNQVDKYFEYTENINNIKTLKIGLDQNGVETMFIESPTDDLGEIKNFLNMSGYLTLDQKIVLTPVGLATKTYEIIKGSEIENSILGNRNLTYTMNSEGDLVTDIVYQSLLRYLNNDNYSIRDIVSNGKAFDLQLSSDPYIILEENEKLYFTSLGNEKDNFLVIDDSKTEAIGGEGGSDFIYGTINDDKKNILGDTEGLNGLLTSGNDTIFGGGGDDTIIGGGGDDYLYGDYHYNNKTLKSGQDYLYDLNNGNTDFSDPQTGLSQSVVLFGSKDGDDTIYGGIGNDHIWGGGGTDKIYGESDNDTIYGGTGDDTIEGGSGDDFLYGEDGIDDIDGGEGDDHIYGGNNDDNIFGGDATLIINDLYTEVIYYDEVIYGDNEKDINKKTGGNDEIKTLEGDDVIYGGGGDDKITSTGGENEIYGGYGIDTITTGDDKDEIYGGSDKDIIEANGGNDEIYGEKGDDTIDGGSGDDTIYGDFEKYGTKEDGDDTISGGDGVDRIWGGGGTDTIYGGDDVDYLYGDYKFGGSDIGQRDNIHGGEGKDLIFGQGGDDRLFGGEGFDVIRGGSGNDIIGGGNGSIDHEPLYFLPQNLNGRDTLSSWVEPTGIEGLSDNLYGGSGNDLYYPDAVRTYISDTSGFDKYIINTSNNYFITINDESDTPLELSKGTIYLENNKSFSQYALTGGYAEDPNSIGKGQYDIYIGTDPTGQEIIYKYSNISSKLLIYCNDSNDPDNQYKITLIDFDNGDLGIFLHDDPAEDEGGSGGTGGGGSIEGHISKDQDSVGKDDPLILDLDGDGITTTTVENGLYFDMDADGFAELTAWAGYGDGLLAIDLNENGIIDNGSELFGDQTLLPNGELAQNGFEALAQYDKNNDYVIDSNDSVFSNLAA